MTEQRLIEVVLLSASNLKDVNYLSKMETFAVMSFPPYVDYTTQVDYHGGLSPTWNEKLGFMIPESVLQRGEGHLKLEIFTLSTLGPKFVSEASIPLTDISQLPRLHDPYVKKYPLKTNSGDFHGEVTVSFSVGDKVQLKVGEKVPTFPIVTGFGTGRPTHDTPSKPLMPSLQPTPPHVSPYDRPMSPQRPIGPLSQPPKDYIPLYQSTPPPTLGKPHGHVPTHVPISPLSQSRPPPTPFFSHHPTRVPPHETIDVPVTRSEQGGGYGRGTGVVPLQSTNHLFGGPLGKMLLTDLKYRSTAYGRSN
ncbi:hypothetical protein L7F22_035154 [Adiantum nelumboides]|nr:hypothetical protein [Adiantum nelumboides]